MFVQLSQSQSGNHSLTHEVPEARDIFSANCSAYPFPIVSIGDNSSPALCGLLPPGREICQRLEMLYNPWQSYPLPYLPDAVTKEEAKNFLEELEVNAEKAPDMLGLIFAMLAVERQISTFHRSGYRWLAGAVKESRKVGDCYRKALYRALIYKASTKRPLQSQPACKLYEMPLS